MTVDDEEDFKSRDKSWICGEFYAKGDHDHVASKCRSSVHKDCNINIRLNKNNSCNVS